MKKLTDKQREELIDAVDMAGDWLRDNCRLHMRLVRDSKSAELVRDQLMHVREVKND